VKLILDEDLSPEVVRQLRRQKIDAVSVHEVGRRGLSDRGQLVLAADDGRCLVTRNRNDFIRLTQEFFARGQAHAGVLIVPWTYAPDRPAVIAKAVARYTLRHGDGPTDFLFDFV